MKTIDNVKLNTTPIYLTDEEAEQFRVFQEYRGLITILHSIGAFELKSGKITIHFDAYGQIGSVDKQQYFRI